MTPTRFLALITAGLVLTACGHDNPLAPEQMPSLERTVAWWRKLKDEQYRAYYQRQYGRN